MISEKTRYEHFSPSAVLSIVVPTYRERENITELIDRIESSLEPLEFELIIVDDNSPDGTAQVAEDLNARYGNIKVLKRTGKLGLSSAVLDGFESARAQVLAVMDADLQHPPELLPKMYGKIREGHDLIVASRYVDEGMIKGWSLRRKIVSKGAKILAHALVPNTGKVKDMISGFFMLKRCVIEGVELNPVGYKVLLEILARGKYNSMVEVPYVFEPRRRGKSNLNIKEAWNYMIHIYKLRRDTG